MFTLERNIGLLRCIDKKHLEPLVIQD
jgi:hypothetical protein